MKELNEFNISIVKLSNAKHSFKYKIGDSFFSLFENSLVEHGNVIVIAELEKNETFINVKFSFGGDMQLVCDRSLRIFDYPLSFEETLIIKYGEEDKEVSESMVMIQHGTQQINLGKYIFEYINLAVPMKKIHPALDNEDSDDDTGFFYSSENTENQEATEQNEDSIDPRWEQLKALKKN